MTRRADTTPRPIPVTDRSMIVARLRATLKAGEHLLLLSDYDGTLTPIVDDPGDAVLGNETMHVLRRLAAGGRVSLGLISGRGLDDLRGMIGLSEVIYAGCHGLEVSGPRIQFRHSGAGARLDVLREAVDYLTRHAERLPGVRIERRTLSVALHYRRASGETLTRLVELLRVLLGRQAGLRMLPGEEVFEILPAVAWDKGRCVLWIESQVRQRVGPRLTTVYMGDDITDESGFRALAARGITIKVGSGRQTVAQHRVRTFEDIRWVLSALVEFLEAGETA